MENGARMRAMWRERRDKRPPLLRMSIFIYSMERFRKPASRSWNQPRLAMNYQQIAAYGRKGNRYSTSQDAFADFDLLCLERKEC